MCHQSALLAPYKAVLRASADVLQLLLRHSETQQRSITLASASAVGHHSCCPPPPAAAAAAALGILRCLPYELPSVRAVAMDEEANARKMGAGGLTAIYGTPARQVPVLALQASKVEKAKTLQVGEIQIFVFIRFPRNAHYLQRLASHSASSGGNFFLSSSFGFIHHNHDDPSTYPVPLTRFFHVVQIGRAQGRCIWALHPLRLGLTSIIDVHFQQQRSASAERPSWRLPCCHRSDICTDLEASHSYVTLMEQCYRSSVARD